MRSIPIADGERFRREVEFHAGSDWPMAMHLAEATGILAGRDGVGSRGIYCELCHFGFHREFGPFPIVAARKSLAHDFTDEAHRRDCPHWKIFLEHPQAVEGATAVPVAAGPRIAAQDGRHPHVCDRCSADAFVLFRCLASQVCFQCFGDLLRSIGGYRGFKSLMTVEPAPDPKARRLRRDPTMGRCRTCRASGRVIAVRGYKYCRPCATARIEKFLAGH